jgi:hypothetical protein
MAAPPRPAAGRRELRGSVALAMRVTPTLVRNVRGWAERDPDYGRPDQSLAHGLSLLSSGCSLRQAAQITGIPKSTLHDAMRAAA